MGGSSSESGSVSPLKPRPRKESLQLDVLRINCLQLLSIDHVNQRFGARMFFHLRFFNGAKDEDLLRDINDTGPPVFPKDTLRPGARWFLHQLDLPTAHEYEVLEAKVVRMGDHVDLVWKVSGIFFEIMELEAFPCDHQRLTAVLAVSVAVEGIVPIRFANLPDGNEGGDAGGNAVVTVNNSSFGLSNMWQLSDKAEVALTTVRPMEATTYPAISFAAFVARRPGFCVTNVALPQSILNSLALAQFLLPGDYYNCPMRITYSVTILLTSATYKLFVSAQLPAISYLTLLDKYILYSFMLQAAFIWVSVILAFFRRGGYATTEVADSWGDSSGWNGTLSSGGAHTFESAFEWPNRLTSGELIDLACFGGFGLVFLLGHAWFGWRMRNEYERSMREFDRFAPEHKPNRLRKGSSSAENYRAVTTLAKTKSNNQIAHENVIRTPDKMRKTTPDKMRRWGSGKQATTSGTNVV